MRANNASRDSLLDLDQFGLRSRNRGRARQQKCGPRICYIQQNTFTRMRQLNLGIHYWLCCLLLLGGMGLRAQTAGRTSSCENELPAQAKKAVTSKLKHWKVLTVADLPADDQEVWQDSYEEKCPGIAVGQFAPGQAQAYAVTLIRRRNGGMYQTLALLTEKKGPYQVTTLARAQKVARPSIVRRLPAGNYSSAKGETQIESIFDVIAYEAIEAGTVIYYWSKEKYRSLIVAE
jgi:hypothetical protein